MKIKFKVRRLIYLILLSITYVSCNSDRFDDTIRYLTTDSTQYQIGDQIELTMHIETTDEEKTIRVYDNFKNTSIWFALINAEYNVHNEKTSHSSDDALPKSKINKIKITPESAFTKTFIGDILSVGDSIKIEFTELNFSVKYSKERLQRDSLRIHGFCDPINRVWVDPLEDYFEVKDIKIKI